MKIAFCTPFKPLDHPNPSGDLMIARELYQHLEQNGHQLRIPSRLRCRWIYWKPENLLRALVEQNRITRWLRQDPIDLWLTYHCYYKAPDLIGRVVCKRLSLPYVILQGSYASKYRRRWITCPGFILNKQALRAADLVVANRQHDLVNLKRIIPRQKLAVINPGTTPDMFAFDQEARNNLQAQWQVKGRPVICSAAMFRRDVKTEGLIWVLESCLRLHQSGYKFVLAIAGDGQQRQHLQRLARKLPEDMVVFTGKIPRQEMYRFYSAGDLFVFPGFRESLGMVFLEAQSCGLPVIACDNGGIPEVVIHQKTGLLSKPYEQKPFDANIRTLLTDVALRRKMGLTAAAHIRTNHDIAKNYQALAHLLEQFSRKNLH